MFPSTFPGSRFGARPPPLPASTMRTHRISACFAAMRRRSAARYRRKCISRPSHNPSASSHSRSMSREAAGLPSWKPALPQPLFQPVPSSLCGNCATAPHNLTQITFSGNAAADKYRSEEAQGWPIFLARTNVFRLIVSIRSFTYPITNALPERFAASRRYA